MEEQKTSDKPSDNSQVESFRMQLYAGQIQQELYERMKATLTRAA
jgi:hypothetical protein